MNIIVCLDNKNGMMFNNRRQSRDKYIINDIKKTIGNNDIYIFDEYSNSLFENSINTVLYDGITDNAYFFAENIHLKQFEDRTEQLIVYRWNKVYPADFFLDINLSNYKKIKSEDFCGNSHKIITKEIYVK